jgi:hypothetical protein
MRLRIGYLILGCLLLIESGFLLYGEIVDGNLQSPIFVLILAISIMFLSLWYLYPQFEKRDERMKVIREKGMFYSYFLLMFYFIIFIILINFNLINISAIGIIMILASLTIMTVFLAMVIISKVL